MIRAYHFAGVVYLGALMFVLGSASSRNGADVASYLWLIPSAAFIIGTITLLYAISNDK